MLPRSTGRPTELPVLGSNIYLNSSEATVVMAKANRVFQTNDFQYSFVMKNLRSSCNEKIYLC